MVLGVQEGQGWPRSGSQSQSRVGRTVLKQESVAFSDGSLGKRRAAKGR